MRPVTWIGRNLLALPWPVGRTQGTAPLPTIWKNGTVVASNPADLLPPDHDAGMVTSLAATDKYFLAAGVAHRTGSAPAAYSGVGRGPGGGRRATRVVQRAVNSLRYFTQTVFTLTKARIPSSPSSRP
jgi:hypothetical protein